MSDDLRIHDASYNFHCPSCGENNQLQYEVIPESILNFEKDGEEHCHHMPPMRDYKCLNCDHEWLQDDALT